MDIKGFIETSLLEWEGQLSSVIFLPGCNLRCRFCHAAHLILNPERSESLSRERIFDYLRGQIGWIDGVVITGGEPTLHGDDLRELIAQIRAVPLQVMIETNGTQPEVIEGLVADGMLDCIAMDVKAPLGADDYERVAGVPTDVEAVRRSIEFIKTCGVDHEFRITVVPGLVGASELERMLPDLEGSRRIAIQNVRPERCLDPALRQVAPFSAEQMDALCAIAAHATERVVLRGRDQAALSAADSE